VIRSYKGPELNRQPMLPYCEETYGAPYLHIHRADFHAVLVKRATELGVQSCPPSPNWIGLGLTIKSQAERARQRHRL
jgi:hypothetical protein